MEKKSKKDRNSLNGNDLLDSLGVPPARHLQGRVGSFALDGGAGGACAAVEVGGQFRVRLELRRVLGQVLVQRELELRFPERLEAVPGGDIVLVSRVIFSQGCTRAGLCFLRCGPARGWVQRVSVGW